MVWKPIESANPILTAPISAAATSYCCSMNIVPKKNSSNLAIDGQIHEEREDKHVISKWHPWCRWLTLSCTNTRFSCVLFASEKFCFASWIFGLKFKWLMTTLFTNTNSKYWTFPRVSIVSHIGKIENDKLINEAMYFRHLCIVRFVSVLF